MLFGDKKYPGNLMLDTREFKQSHFWAARVDPEGNFLQP